MKEINGKKGRVIFGDCISLLKQLKEKGKRFELCITDPPYNVNLCTSLNSYNDKMNKGKIYYKDKMKPEKYQAWCFQWFDLLKDVCERIVFTPGYANLRMWYLKEEFESVYWLNMYKQGGSKVAKLNKVEPILCYGDFTKKKFRMSIFVYNHGFNMEFDLPNTNHPCPKPVALYQWILDELKPKSVLDIFMGSGTTAEACESRNIKYLGFELKNDYSNDIIYRVRRGVKSSLVAKKLGKHKKLLKR